MRSGNARGRSVQQKKSSDVQSTDEVSEEPEAVPSTSSAPDLETQASARKLHYFEKKKGYESSDSDSEPGPSHKQIRMEEDVGEEEVEPVPDSDMNVIVNMSCLQSLITKSWCPECKEPNLRVLEGGPELRMESACFLELKCLGKTLNSNESFHSLLWSLCPKQKWGNLRTVDTALNIAVQRFNKGSTALLDVMKELDLVVGSSLEEYALKEDISRVSKATKKSSDKEKERRKRVEIAKCKEQQERRDREGEVYGAGQF